MNRKIVATDSAPAAIGPYSQGIMWQNLLFCSGQIPIDPDTGQLVDGDIQSQAARVIKNLEAVLMEGNSSLRNILRLEVYLTDLTKFPEVNEFLGRIFPDAPPARITLGVSELPLGAEIEIAAIAGIK